MSTATNNVRLDANDLKQYGRRVVKDNKLPCEISSDIPNEDTLAAIEEVKRMRAYPKLGKTYTNVDCGVTHEQY